MHPRNLLLVLLASIISVRAVAILPYDPNKYVHLIGRWTVNSANSGAIGDWAGIAAQATFTNTSYVSFSASTSHSDYANALVYNADTGALVVSRFFQLTNVPATYEISLTLDPNVRYKVDVNKRTDPSQGAMTLYGLQFADTVVLNNDTVVGGTRRLQFIGGSILTGYGDDATTCTVNPADSDSYDAWGSVIARNLSADYSIQAYRSTGVATPILNLPDIFNMTLAGDATYGSWDFSFWMPHAVVINFGAEDLTGVSPVPSETFTAALAAFIQRVRATYSASLPFIILVCGPTSTTDFCSSVYAAAVQTDVIYVSFDGVLSAEEMACGFPNSISHQKLADKLTPTLQAYLQWDNGGSDPIPTVPPTQGPTEPAPTDAPTEPPTTETPPTDPPTTNLPADDAGEQTGDASSLFSSISLPFSLAFSLLASHYLLL